MPGIISNGINIFYETYGKGNTLILLSGLGCDHTLWSAGIETLAQHYHVVVFDPRGMGQTDAPHEPYSISMLADDLAGLMDALQIDKAHIVGHSMGGCIAQLFALRYPDRVMKLILAASFAVNNKQTRLFLDAILSVYEQGTSAKQVHALFAPWLYSARFLGTPGNEPYFTFNEHAPYQQPFYAWKNQYLAIREFNSVSLLAGIKSPTLIIAADQDRIAHVSDSEILRANINNSKMVIINNAGHLLNYEQPATFYSHIQGFLS